MLNVQHNIGNVIKDFQKLRESVVRAERSANKKIAQQVVTKLSQNARTTYNVKSSELKDGMKIKYDESNHVSSRIIFSARKIPLVNFGARSSRSGVTVMVHKGNRKIIKSSFIPLLKSGRQNIFVRSHNGSLRVGRLPIKQLYGPAPSQMLFNRNAQEVAITLIQTKWDKIFQHELEFYGKR